MQILDGDGLALRKDPGMVGEAIVGEDLGSEPLRRRLAVSPLQQALMGLINPHRFVLFGHGFPNRT